MVLVYSQVENHWAKTSGLGGLKESKVYSTFKFISLECRLLVLLPVCFSYLLLHEKLPQIFSDLNQQWFIISHASIVWQFCFTRCQPGHWNSWKIQNGLISMAGSSYWPLAVSSNGAVSQGSQVFPAWASPHCCLGLLTTWWLGSKKMHFMRTNPIVQGLI